MPTDEQIRDLCARVLGASRSEFESAIRELQSAIRHRLEDLSNHAIATLLKMPRVSRVTEKEPKDESAAPGDKEEQVS